MYTHVIKIDLLVSKNKVHY